jgi:surface protein
MSISVQSSARLQQAFQSDTTQALRLGGKLLQNISTKVAVLGLFLLFAGGVSLSETAQAQVTFTKAGAGLTGMDGADDDWGDYDNDGDLDLVITGSEGPGQSGPVLSTTIYKNDGSGNFTAIGASLPGMDGGSADWIDVDGDNDLDLLLTGADDTGSPTAEIYENQGSDTFAAMSAGLTGVSFSSAAVGDVDGDGDMDLLVNGEDGSANLTATIYTNDGSGSFTENSSSGLTGFGSASSDFGDIDNDGDLDVVIGGDDNGTTTTKVFENDGSGSYSALSTSLQGISLGSVEFGDYNADGNLDLVIAGADDQFTNYAIIYKGDGTGGFTDISAGLSGVNNGEANWGDVDGDGDLDVVVAGFGDSFAGTATLYINEGSDTFSASSASLDAVEGASVSWAEVNGDSNIDLFISGVRSSDYNQSATIYLNNGSAPTNNAPVFNSSATASVVEGTSTSTTVLDVNADDGDGGSDDSGITYSITGGEDSGDFAIDASTGELTFTAVPDYDQPADADANNEYLVTVQADDGEASNNTATQDLTITVTANTAPIVATPIADVTVDENAPSTTIDLTTHFSDAEESSADLTYSVQNNTNTSLINASIDNTTNELTVEFVQREYGTADITIQAADADGLTAEDTFTITVTPLALQLTLLPDRIDTLTTYPGFTDTLRFTLQKSNGTPVITDSDLDLSGSVSNDVELTSTIVPVYDANKGNWYVTFTTADDFASPGSMTIDVDYTNYVDRGDSKSVVLDPRGNRPFVTTWDVSGDNMSVTFPTADQIDGDDLSNYNFRIDWGNGEDEWINGAAPAVSKSYATSGTKTVKISGDFPYLAGTATWSGNETTGNLQSVTQWGDIQWESMKSSFASIPDLSIPASDVPDLSGVTSMESMFAYSGITTPDLSGWDVSGVTNMNNVFTLAANFNSDISAWDVGSVQKMNEMFNYAQSFNQDIGGWNVASVDSMVGMFINAAAFDQNLGEWDISQVVSFDDEAQGATFMNGTALSTANYDSLLIGWGAQSVQPNLTISFGDTKYTLKGLTAHGQLENAGWTINDGGLSGNPFITTWRTTSTNETVTIPTGGGAEITDFDFIIVWGDGTSETITGDDPDPSHTYSESGTYTVIIEGTFPHMQPGADGDLDQLTSIEAWGGIKWESMRNSFAWARNMTYNATDAPDLSGVTDMAGMFFAAEQFNGDLSSWTTTGVTDMSYMFDGATVFKGDISTWDVSEVTNMREMFQGATSFNGDLSGWTPSKVTNMFGMFNEASSFNQDVSSWTVSSVTDMGGMFLNASSFDQDISDWDISNVTRLDNGQYGFLQGTAISQQNYDLLLNKWSQLADVNTGLSLSVGNTKYGVSGAERQQLIDDKNWTINDGGPFQPFTTTWEITSDNPTITIGTVGGEDRSDFDFTINWGDGTVKRFTGDKPAVTHTYADFATQTVQIAGTFPEMNSSVDGAVVSSLRTVEQWGDISWETMSGMFAGITNLVFNTEDIPDLSEVESMEAMFASLSGSNFNSDISDWDVSNVTNMKQMFLGAMAFNQDISAWEVDSVTTMEAMFYGALSFDQDLGDWNVSKVTKFSTVEGSGDNENIIGFLENSGLSSANYDSLLAGWSQLELQNSEDITLDVGDTEHSLSSAKYKQTITSNFNWTIIDGGLNIAPFITSWKTTSADESVTIPTGGGTDTPNFVFIVLWGDGSIDTYTGDDPDPTHTYADAGTYSVQIAGDFPHFRPDAEGDLDQLVSIDQWGEVAWYSMNHSFAWAKNMTLKATDTPELSNVSSTRAMFKGATKFNGDVGHWNTAAVDTLADMFSGASSFDQDIGDWDISGVVSLHDTDGFLNGSGLTRSNYDSLLVGWATQSGLSQNLTLNVGDVQYTNSPGVRSAREKFLEENGLNWTIVDGGPFGRAPEIAGFPGLYPVEKAVTTEIDLSEFISDDRTALEDLVITVEAEEGMQDEVTYNTESRIMSIAAPAEQDTFKVDISVKDEFDLVTNETVTFISFAPYIITVRVAPENDESTYPNEYGYWLRTSQAYNYDFLVDWGDGNGYQRIKLSGNDHPFIIKEYDRDGSKVKTIKIMGKFPYFGDLNGYERFEEYAGYSYGLETTLAFYAELQKIESVEQWGDIVWENMNESFIGTGGFEINAKDVPNLSKVEDMSEMFSTPFVHASQSPETINYNGNLSFWDVSNVKNMDQLFFLNEEFNNYLFWDVSNVESMAEMFYKATSFNQNIAFWDVSSVRDMKDMFKGASSFDQDLSGWAVNSVERFEEAGITNKRTNKRPSESGNQTLSSEIETLSGFLVGSGMSTENVSKMFVGWKDKLNPEVKSISVGDIELNEEGAAALREVRETNGIDVTWGGEEGVDDEPKFSGLNETFVIEYNTTIEVPIWDYVEDKNTPDDELKLSFDVIADSSRTIGYDQTTGELSITATAEEDAFKIAIQAVNTEGIAALDTMEVETGVATYIPTEGQIPEEYVLNQNYPNPFNPSTTIVYALPETGNVRLDVFNILGQRVATLINERVAAGTHHVHFDASRLSSGLYIYRLHTSKAVITKRMTLIK